MPKTKIQPAAEEEDGNCVVAASVLCQSCENEKIGSPDGESQPKTVRKKKRKWKKHPKRVVRKLELVLVQPVITIARGMYHLEEDILIDVFRFLAIEQLFRLNWHSRRLFHVAGKHRGVAEVLI
jgi:hypothetical protein